MARLFKNPNPYSKVLDHRHNSRILSVCFILLGLATAFWYTQTKDLYAAIIVLLSCGVLFSVVNYVLKRIKQNDRGQDGELAVSQTLGLLPNDYIIFQNVPIKKHLDIDLVLVGPTGVYAIEVKSYAKFKLFGNGKDFIHETLSETMGLKESLKKSGIDVYVNSLLVFSRAFVSA